jgi:hypothetical protein
VVAVVAAVVWCLILGRATIDSGSMIGVSNSLSTAAALLILAIYRETPFKERLLALTLIRMGLCVVVSVFGMLLIAIGSRKPPRTQTTLSEEAEDAIARWITVTAGIVFMGSVIAFALSILAVPFRPALWILLTLLGLLIGLRLFVGWRRRRRSAPPRSP